MRTIQIKVREDFSYTVQTNYLDWGIFDRIKPHYFAKDTTKFFQSKRYADPVWCEQLAAFIWVQSDKAPMNRRKYSIRSIELNGYISIVQDGYWDLKYAERALRALINGK